MKPSAPLAPHALIEHKMPPWMHTTPAPAHTIMRETLKTPPTWFAQANATTRDLAQAYTDYQAHSTELNAQLGALPALTAFATQHLRQAIEKRFALSLDVSTHYLINASKAEAYKLQLEGDPVVNGQRALKLATQSLLHCALQNFEEAEAEPNGLDGQWLSAAVVDSNTFTFLTPDGKQLSIVPHEFAALSRELDIGGQYQTLIGDVLNSAAPALRATEQAALRVEVHKAYLSHAIDAELHSILLALVEDKPAEYQGSPVRCAGLALFGVPLTGAMVIGAVASPEQLLAYDPLLLPHKGLLVTYLPGSDTPLQQHHSVHEAQAHLREQLWMMPVDQLKRAVPARDSATFFEKLRDCLQPVDWSTVQPSSDGQGSQVERVRDPEAWVPVTLEPLRQPLLSHQVEHKQQRLKDDAAFHAVPTAVEDEKTAERRRAYFTQLAFDALNISAFFIPVLGQVMMGVAAIQLSYEVFEGLDSWASGDQQQAFEYLMDVVENVALTAALGAAGGTGEVPALERIPVETPSFIEELTPIELPDGQTRLWAPDLRPFAHDILLPADLQPDEFGLYHHQGKTWLALDGTHYSLSQATPTGEYRLEHPHNPQSYQPSLRHNGAGAWLHELDQPLTWQALTLMRRASPLAAAFDDATITRILEISDTQEDVLRRIVADNQRLPALLEDTLARFTLDQQISRAPAYAEPHMAQAEFAKRYSALSSSVTPSAELIQQRYPQLPNAIVEELLRHATPEELQSLAQAKVPYRLAQEIRLYQQQVRLARAYEGLFLDSVRNADSERLALYTLEQLSDWPTGTRLTLEQLPGGTFEIGTTDTQGQTLVSTASGYLAESATSLSSHTSLYSALLEVIPTALRETLTGDGAEQTLALKRLIQANPLPRATFRRLLGMQPLNPGYRSPMRLADGRIGYPLGGRGAVGGTFTRHTLLRIIRTLELPEHLSRSAEQILTRLETSGMNRSDIHNRLRELQDQRTALQRWLDDWRTAVHPDILVPPQTFSELQARFMDHWHRNALPALGDTQAPLHLERIDLSSFPSDLPDFLSATITHVQLTEPSFGSSVGWTAYERHLNNLFRQLPGVRSLEISRPYSQTAAPSQMLFSVGLMATHFPELESLSLLNQNLQLSESDINSLAGLPRLRRLDFSGNRLSERYRPNFRELTLDYLGLDRMTLDHWPQGLGLGALANIGELSLRDNNLRVLPGMLLNSHADARPHTVITLEGNRISDDQLLRLLLAQEASSPNVTVDISPSLRTRLDQHLQQRQTLHEAIDQWANASSSSAPPSQAATLARRRIGSALSTFWQSQEQGLTQTTLRLEDMDLGHFPPQLPAFFNERVRNLSLSRASGSTEQLDAFLARLPNVESLNLVEYIGATQTLPTALLRLPRLTYLSMRDMNLEVDDSMLATLAHLSNLTVLDLGGNRMGTITQVPEALRNLRRLDLNNMGLQHWPAWIDSLLPMDMLDLSENQLTELPEHILSNIDNGFPISSIALFGNPLSMDTMTRARTSSDSQHSYTFAMDVPEDLLFLTSSDDEMAGGHLHNPMLSADNDLPNVDDWSLGAQAQNEALRSAWETLEESGDAANLLALVGRLRQAAPYRNGQTRQSFCERVRLMLVKAAVNTEERLLFNAVAEEALVQPDTGNQTCHDGALLVFQNIELLIDGRRLLTEAAESEHTLYRELRRLFRLHRLDEIARDKARGRDEAEVRLAYRRGLNAELKLGVPDDNMLYEAFADVSRNELALAVDQVHREEQGESFLNYATSNEEWIRYLRHTHQARFEAIEQQYQAQVLELPEQFPDSTLEQLAPEFDSLKREKQAKEARLIQELTLQANPERE